MAIELLVRENAPQKLVVPCSEVLLLFDWQRKLS